LDDNLSDNCNSY